MNFNSNNLSDFRPDTSDFPDSPVITPEDILKDVESNISQFEKKSSKTPPFPVDAFPKHVQNIINDFYKAYQLPKDYYGLGILTVCATAIGNAYQLKYKNGYNVSPILYSAIVGSSSIGKTPVLKACLSPIFRIEEQYESNYNNDLSQYEIEQENSEKPQRKPQRKEMLVNDVTAEALSKVLSKNPKGIIRFQDELIAWINSLDQYRKGSDTELYISNWGNSTAKINRVGKAPIYIRKPFVNVLGGIQPSILDGLAGNGKKDNGFLFRILFAYPDSQKKPYESDYSPSPETFQFFQDLVFGIHNLPNKIKQVDNNWVIESIPIELSNEARKLYRKFSRNNTDLINEATNDRVKSLYGKLKDYCLRFALILEIMDIASHKKQPDENTKVSEKSIQGAIDLTEYFRATGMKVLNRIEKVNPLEDYSTQKQLIYNDLPEEFTTAEGVEIAGKHQMPKRTFKRFLLDNELFEKVKRGYYLKTL